MSGLFNVVMYVYSTLGSTVVMPIFLTIIGMIFGMKFWRALRSGLTVIFGLAGINLIIGYLGGALSPAITGITSNIDVAYNTVDVGFPTIASAVFSLPIAAGVIPICIIINIVMLALRWTKTIDIDIWNMFQIVMCAGIAYVLSNNLLVSFVVGAIFFIVTLKIADWEAPVWQKELNLPGTVCCALPESSTAIMTHFVNKIIDLIPGLKDFDISATKTNKLKILSDPIFLGLAIGTAFGLLGRLDIVGVLNTAIGLAATLVLMPKMAALLLEGCAPISQAAKKFMTERANGREVYIAVDIACGIGNPNVITTSTIGIPLYILLATILPGNTWFPLVSITGLCWNAVACVIHSKNNLFRSIVCMILFCIGHCYVETYLAPQVTQLVTSAGMAVPEGFTYVAGGSPETLFMCFIKPLLSVLGLVK